jgi:hypothetical protein
MFLSGLLGTLVGLSRHRTMFEFVINLKAAKQIGLTIPVNVIERAIEVIKVRRAECQVLSR